MDMYKTILIAVLTVLGLVTAGLWVLRLRSSQGPLRFLTVALSTFLSEYLAAAGLLFWFDWFTLVRASALVLIVNVLICLVQFIRARKNGPGFAEIDWDLKKELFPVLFIVLGLLFSSVNFTFFGMGQDEGVYQTKALDLMYGVNRNSYVLSEYSKLDTEEQKQSFVDSSLEWLVGLYNANDKQDEYAPEAPDAAADNVAYYHGSPAYCAALALFGTLFGAANMAHLQTLTYLLGALLIWYTAQNLKLKKLTGCFAVLLYLLSPESIWLSKSTLTEPYLSMIIAMFMYLMTNDDRKGQRWMSALTVASFAFLHITVYVMMPMFAVLYVLLYLYTDERQYLKALITASLGYMAGMAQIFAVSPFYAYHNTIQIMVGPINAGNVYQVVLGAGVLLILLAAGLGLIRRRTVRFPEKVDSPVFAWLIRAAVVVCLAYAVFTIVQKAGKEGAETAVLKNGLYDIIWMTGIFSLPVTTGYLFLKPRKLLGDELRAGITFLYLYAIVFRVCMLQPNIEYCYYYGRYLGPLIPFLCVMAGVVWDRFSTRSVGIGLTACTLAMAPFDATLISMKDDSKAEYTLVERVAEAVRTGGDDTAVVFSVAEGTYLFYLPVRAMTEADCYFTEENVSAQINRLGREYEKVMYLVFNANQDPIAVRAADETLLKITEPYSDDDNETYRLPWVPFPYTVRTGTSEFALYGYDRTKSFPAAELHTVNGTLEDGALVLEKGALQFGPYINLPTGTYDITVHGANLFSADVVVTAESGKVIIPYYDMIRDGDMLRYSISLEEKMTGVEFLTVNNTEEPMAVYGIEMEKRALIPGV